MSIQLSSRESLKRSSGAHGTDCGDRRKLQRMLRASDPWYRAVFENVPIGVCWVGVDGRVLYCNRVIKELVGYADTELRRMNVTQLVEGAESCRRLLDGAENGDCAQQVEGKLIRKGGGCAHVLLAGARVALNGGEVVLVSAVDITPRKLVEAELQDLGRTLREKQRALEQKGIALAETIEQIEIGKNLLKEHIAVNIQEFVLPILEKLRLTEASGEYLDLLEHNLRQITSKFGIRVSQVAPSLSPRESEITGLIQCGLTSKQIAQLLNICGETVEKHRRDIRRKIGISGQKINLASFLHCNS